VNSGIAQGKTAWRGSRLGHRILVGCCLTGTSSYVDTGHLTRRDLHRHDENGLVTQEWEEAIPIDRIWPLTWWAILGSNQ
jgi:hypothetical protein